MCWARLRGWMASPIIRTIHVVFWTRSSIHHLPECVFGGSCCEDPVWRRCSLQSFCQSCRQYVGCGNCIWQWCGWQLYCRYMCNSPHLLSALGLSIWHKGWCLVELNPPTTTCWPTLVGFLIFADLGDNGEGWANSNLERNQFDGRSRIVVVR